MQTQDVRLTIRIDRELKKNAETLFNYIGLNMSNAVNIFLRKAVEQKGIPFPVALSTTGSGEINEIAGLKTDDITNIFNKTVDQSITEKKRLSCCKV